MSCSQFMGADHRFLTMAAELLGDVAAPLPWCNMQLSTTFRLPWAVAEFLNVNVLGFPLFLSPKPRGSGVPVRYYTGNTFTIVRKLAQIIASKIKNGELRPDDIFVLAPSTAASGNSDDAQTSMLADAAKPAAGSHEKPIHVLGNILKSEHGIPCYSPSEDVSVGDLAARGKVVFCTMHQSKGLERACVVLFDFSKVYYGIALPKIWTRWFSRTRISWVRARVRAC
jgi:hypothetical protein